MREKFVFPVFDYVSYGEVASKSLKKHVLGAKLFIFCDSRPGWGVSEPPGVSIFILHVI
jgi:hypothetical protein